MQLIRHQSGKIGQKHRILESRITATCSGEDAAQPNEGMAKRRLAERSYHG
jgi:hypothetical protein